MTEKSYKSSLFKRIVDLGVVRQADVDDLVRIWRVGTGDEKAITLANFVATVDADLGSGGSTLTELIEELELNKVPYTGATGNVDLGEFGIRGGYFKFDTTPTSTPTDQGTVFWDEDDLTVDIILNGYRMKIGEDQFYPVKNQTGVLIPKGTSVRFNGTVGSSGRLLIAPFLADGSLPSTRFMGVTAEDIDNGEDGKVLWFGRLRGIDTSAFAEGDILYASTTVAGAFQTTVPVSPNNIVEIAAVVTDATNGTIFIRPQFISKEEVGVGLSRDGLGRIQLGDDFITYNEGQSLSLYIEESSPLRYLDSSHSFGASTIYSGGDMYDANRGGGGYTANIGSNNVRTALYLLKPNFNQFSLRLDYNVTTDIFEASFIDGINSKGIVYGGDYESNFTARSLVTKQYVDGAVSGATISIGSPANGLSLAGTVLSLGLASSSTTGALSGTDWNTFNGKLNLTSPLTGFTVGTNTPISSSNTILSAFQDVQGQINARVSGTIASGQVAFGTGVNTVGGDSGLTWDNVNKRLTGTSATLTSNFYVSGGLNTNIGNGIHIFNEGNYAQVQLNGVTGSLIDFSTSGTDFLGRIIYLNSSNSMQFHTNSSGTASMAISSARAVTLSNTLSVQSGVTISTNGLTLAGSQSIVSTSNGNISISPNGTGLTLIGPSASPTNTLDVNGTARIRTISNLGSTATRFLVASATGVISERTGAEIRTDISAVPTTRTLTINGTALDLSADRSWTIGADGNKVSYNVADSKTPSERLQARVNIGSTSATPQVIATVGAINNLAVTSNHLVFTGSTVVLSGIAAGLDGEEITILNASGTNLELLSQSALSTDNNRFASGLIVPNLSVLRIKYRTTTARWVLENVGINDGRYVRKDVADTKTGLLTLNDGLSVPTSTINALSSSSSNNGHEFGLDSILSFRVGRYNGTFILGRPTNMFYRAAVWIDGTNAANVGIFTDGSVYHLRSNSSDRSVRRDELYLNYSETVATAGTINNLAINASTKLLILTGATDLTGVVPVDNTRLLRIEARGAARIIRDQSTSSTDVNRFALGADLTINAGEVYQFIYTDSRWRRIL